MTETNEIDTGEFDVLGDPPPRTRFERVFRAHTTTNVPCWIGVALMALSAVLLIPPHGLGAFIGAWMLIAGLALAVVSLVVELVGIPIVRSRQARAARRVKSHRA